MTDVGLQCPAGKYCPLGTASPTLDCPYGWQCPAGSGTPINCPSGYYQDQVGQAACKLCPEGYYCDVEDKCPYATYLPNGSFPVVGTPGSVFQPNATVINGTTCVEFDHAIVFVKTTPRGLTGWFFCCCFAS